LGYVALGAMPLTWEVNMGLTAATVKALLAKPPDKITAVADGHVDGLALRIMPSGYASWAVEYTRPVGGRARYTIGPVLEIGLAEARAQALEIRARARRGEDPHFDRRSARLKAEQQKKQATAGTVAELAQHWFASREAKSWRGSTRASFESLLGRHVLPALGQIQAADVTKADVRALLDRVHDETQIGSNRVFELVRSMYNWGRSKDLVAGSPCDGVKKIEKERRRERTYTDGELRAIVEAVSATGLADLVGLILRTATRSHEGRAMRWNEIDFDRRVWTIPPENAKARRKHEVPLAPGAWSIIERRFRKRGGSPFVFTGDTGPCTVCAQPGHALAPLNRRLRALSIAAGFLKNVGTKEKPQWEGDRIRLHDVRRTVADRMLNVLRIAPYVVDLGVLAHAPAGLIRTYMPSGVALPEVQAAMAAWDAHLDQILAGSERKATVTAISKSRRRA